MIQAWYLSSISASVIFPKGTNVSDIDALAAKWVNGSNGVLDAFDHDLNELGQSVVILCVAAAHAPYDHGDEDRGSGYLPISDEATLYITRTLDPTLRVEKSL